MKRTLVALFFALNTAFAIACPTPVPVLEPAAIEAMYRQPENKGVLLTAHRGESTVWLYGTIHVNRPTNSLPGPAAIQALRAADALFLEMDPLKPANQADFLAEAALGKPLDEAQKRRVADLAASHCLPSTLKDKSAMLAVNALSVEMLKEEGFFPDYGTDIILRGMATSLSKPVRELETPEQQATYLSGLTEGDAKIEETLDALEDGTAALIGQRLVTAWTRQDRRAFKALGEEIGMLDENLQQRNRLMADTLDEHLAGHPGKVFVAVGVFHLVGEDNLAALLKEKGFDFQR